MSSRSKYFYAVEEDWPEVLSELDAAVDIEYVEERALDDWTFKKYITWGDLPPLRKTKEQIFGRSFLIVTPPGREFPPGKPVQGAHPNWRPQVMTTPGTVMFDPCGYDESLTEELGAQFIDE